MARTLVGLLRDEYSEGEPEDRAIQGWFTGWLQLVDLQ